jgi:uncharacterized protein
MTTYTISKKFTSSVERSPRVLEIAEAFGLGLSSKEFIVYDNLAIDVEQGDVVYITGQSGSGKSLLLRDLVDQMRAGGLKVTDLNEITLEEKPVIELVGKTTGEAAEILAKAGISDAWIYIRKPSELSDGQRYRLKLAIVMNSDADVWVADEFGAVLDRVTARVVAFSMAKVARRAGKTFMVATTHNDMIAELAPSLMITKRFREKVEIATKLDSHEAAA